MTLSSFWSCTLSIGHSLSTETACSTKTSSKIEVEHIDKLVNQNKGFSSHRNSFSWMLKLMKLIIFDSFHLGLGWGVIRTSFVDKLCLDMLNWDTASLFTRIFIEKCSCYF
jgi:hypothetical protein